MALRNQLVRPFGLISSSQTLADVDHVGMFPVVSQTEERWSPGRRQHLDFRVVVEVSAGNIVTATTLVRTHNRWGRTHWRRSCRPRLIVRSMLARSPRALFAPIESERAL